MPISGQKIKSRTLIQLSCPLLAYEKPARHSFLYLQRSFVDAHWVKMRDCFSCLEEE